MSSASISVFRTQTLLACILVPSGINKVVNPKPLKELFPRLPKWFWCPCGLWEMTGAILCYKGLAPLGLPLLYPFMGGVFYSICYLKDENGKTYLSGKGKLGKFGPLLLLPASFTLAVLLKLDKVIHSKNTDASNSTVWWLLPALTYCFFGAVWGNFCTKLKKS
mmetsp:Transcript_21105/g.33967  ORF Transcript_21105/g.33967 Transcript_21105/m.33967 type:complete len:164 (+) Transcript_21105:541-1032(+)